MRIVSSLKFSFGLMTGSLKCFEHLAIDRREPEQKEENILEAAVETRDHIEIFKHT